MTGQLEPFKLERYFAEHEFNAPYLLGSSDCETLTVGELLALEDGVERAYLALRLGYTESRGAPELRREIAGLYRELDDSQILVHAGAEEAIYAFQRAILKAGERVVVQVPCYQSLASLARYQGCEVVQWRPSATAPWRWSSTDLERLATPRARAIIVNSPHNPTGYQMPEETFLNVVRIAEERGALLFSDEVYRLSELDGPPLPAACDASDRAVSLGVLSKSFGLPGLRIGWLATRNASVLDAVASYKDYLTICNSAPSEFLATLALRHKDAILTRVRDLLRTNREIADAFVRKHADHFEWAMPSAGPIGFVRLKNGLSADALCVQAVRAGVMLVSSTQFDYGDEHVRVGFGRASFPRALARFEEVVARLPGP